MAAGVTLGFDQAPPTAQLGFAVVQASALFLSATGGTGLPQASTPTFSPAAGSYSGTQTVTISDSTTGSSIYLTTDGTTPTYPITGSTRLYASPITVSASETIKAIAVATGYTQSAVGSAAYVISASGFVNPMAINFPAGGTGLLYYEGLPIFKNRVRESAGFQVANGSGPVALTSAGWPAADFQVGLLYGGTLPAWASGNFTCGFIGSGSESIAALGACSISNVVHGSAGAYTTFTLTPSGIGFGFIVTGTTGGATNVFAYLPEYNANTAIDFPSTASSVPASAYTNEAIAHYSQFAYIRLMEWQNAINNTQVCTSATRRTIANSQAPPNQGSGFSGNFTTTPANGATSAVISSWQFGPGTFALTLNSSTTPTQTAAIATIGSGTSNVSCTFSAPLACTPTGTAFGMGIETNPIAYMIGLANACGNLGLWINLPILEDGTNNSSGSYSSSLMTELSNTYTSTGPLRFELANELWQGDDGTYVLSYLANLYTAGDEGHYMGIRMVSQAAAIKVKFSAQFGNTVLNVLAWQTQGNGIAFVSSALGYISANYGPPLNYVANHAIAPYGQPTIGSSDSVAQIIADVAAVAPTQAYTADSETIAVNALQYGVSLVAYEAAECAWDGFTSSPNVNLGNAIMNTGMTTPVITYYQTLLNSGFQFVNHFKGGVSITAGTLQPEDEFTTNYSALSTAPVLVGLQSFMTSFTPTRNVVSGSGSVISGSTFLDNVQGSLSINGYGKGAPKYGNNGYTACIINCTAPRTYTVVVTWSGVSGGVTSNLEYGSVGNAATVSETGVNVVNGAVTMGSVNLRQGINYVCLGRNGSQTATVTQVQFN